MNCAEAVNLLNLRQHYSEEDVVAGYREALRRARAGARVNTRKRDALPGLVRELAEAKSVCEENVRKKQTGSAKRTNRTLSESRKPRAKPQIQQRQEPKSNPDDFWLGVAVAIVVLAALVWFVFLRDDSPPPRRRYSDVSLSEIENAGRVSCTNLFRRADCSLQGWDTFQGGVGILWQKFRDRKGSHVFEPLAGVFVRGCEIRRSPCW